MQTNQHYTQLLQDLKVRISQSRFIAARLVNREQLLFYMQKAAEDHWSVSVLEHHIKENLFLQIGKLHHNFDATIDTLGSTAAAELFKDKYLLDYLQLNNDHNEGEIEHRIVSNITEFILKMGKGFTFLGHQFRLDVVPTLLRKEKMGQLF